MKASIGCLLLAGTNSVCLSVCCARERGENQLEEAGTYIPADEKQTERKKAVTVAGLT